MTRPYIGVSGLMSEGESREVARLYREAWTATGREPTHALMLGALVSAKTLGGASNKYPLRYPKIGDVGSVFQTCVNCRSTGVEVFTPFNSTIADDERLPCRRCSGGPPRFYRLNLVHYASDVPPDLQTLMHLDADAGPGCHGFQFNAAWPTPETLLKFTRTPWEPPRIVLQYGPRRLAEMGAGASVAWALKPYAGLATDVLLDASGGEGRPIDAEAAAWPLSFLDKGWGAGIAGGLCAEALEAQPVIGRMLGAGCSIDAEGRLRDGADGGGNLDMAKVGAYLRAAVRLATGALP